MAFLHHKGRVIYYRLLGDNAKPLLILAHALGMTQGAWDDTLPALLERFRVLTWDLPGHGASAAWPEGSDEITPEDLAAEALALADLAGADTFRFVGTSIGGVVGQQLLAYHHKRLVSAVLTNTGAVIGTRDRWETRSADVLQKGLEVMSEAIVPRWFGPESCRQQPALVEGWAGIMGRGDARSYALLCEMLGTCNYSEKLKQLSTPLLLVGGSDDVATPPASLQTLAQVSGAAAPIILEQIGHVPSVECPARLSQILIDYLS
ncbi:alpha/beta fold hydrolase [Pseudomonas sp.]|uniref:alpha/beta fold hydrolase n=1 Tax=Pseudomonas sp. TaxID=306 RepID=UPI00272DA7AD|nr:alpha/beta fold hydrolase [Pseudomonas sp.]